MNARINSPFIFSVLLLLGSAFISSAQTKIPKDLESLHRLLHHKFKDINIENYVHYLDINDLPLTINIREETTVISINDLKGYTFLDHPVQRLILSLDSTKAIVSFSLLSG